MELKIKTEQFELFINNADKQTLTAIFDFMKNAVLPKPFFEKYNKNYIEPVNGIRTHENGTKEYKCSYKCKCGKEGVRYVHEDADRTACHRCKSELTIYPSSMNDAHDDEFNYFVAYSEG
jgi:hypothetical protein